MNWVRIKELDKIDFKCIDNALDLYLIYLSPREYTNLDNLSELNELDEVETFDYECLEILHTGLPSTYYVKEELLKALDDWDKSEYVNKFKFKNLTFWFNKEERSSLRYVLNLYKSEGNSTYKVWINNDSYMIDITTMLNFLDELEKYAVAAFDATATHRKNILNTDNREEIFNYNITANYPEPIELIID